MLILIDYDDIIVASLIPQFVGPKKRRFSRKFEWSENPKFGETTGLIKTYGTSGYLLVGKDSKEIAKNFKSIFFSNPEINLRNTIIDLELEALIIHGLYYVPSYRSWILKTIIFEFPRDNDIKSRVRIDPIRLTNKDDPDVKLRFYIDMSNIFLQLVLGVFRLLISYKTDLSRALSFFFFNLVIFGLVILSHLFYFNFHRPHHYDIDDFSFFNSIFTNANNSKKVMIVAFLLHAY